MSVFTVIEIEYPQSQHLGRLATVNPHGRPQNAPMRFFYNPATDTIDIGGRTMSQTQKLHNVEKNPDVASGGKAVFGPNYAGDESILRITPQQIIGWGLDTGPYQKNNRKIRLERSNLA